jgi:RNA polymerase sigma-70 factor (ECF subfamily)
MYDRALPQVFGYLRTRVGTEATAEDLTAETFLAAVQAIERRTVPDLTVAWLIGVARHKLVDHWRRESREARHLQALPDESVVDDDVEARFERDRAHEVLEELGAPLRRAHTPVSRRSLGARGRGASRPHGARDRGPARTRAQRVPSRLRAR